MIHEPPLFDRKKGKKSFIQAQNSPYIFQARQKTLSRKPSFEKNRENIGLILQLGGGPRLSACLPIQQAFKV